MFDSIASLETRNTEVRVFVKGILILPDAVYLHTSRKFRKVVRL